MLRRPINQLVAQGIMPCKYDFFEPLEFIKSEGVRKVKQDVQFASNSPITEPSDEMHFPQTHGEFLPPLHFTRLK